MREGRWIRSRDDVDRGLDWLGAADPRLASARERVEAIAPVPLRLEQPGFAPLVEIVCTQQISRASAAAIHARLVGEVRPLDPEGILAMEADTVRRIGLSRSKVTTLKAVATAVRSGRLDLGTVCDLPAEEAIRTMCAVPGIGPWTSGVYLLFCAGHSDIMPSGDVALQWSASMIDGRTERMSARELERRAERWSPWRSVAARLLWANYAVARGRAVIP